MGDNMSKKITFDSAGFPRFDEDGEYETDLNTNRVDRFYLDGEELKDKYSGKTDKQIEDLEHAAHLTMVAQLEVQDAAIRAEKGLDE
jgi:hypothetical protein